MQIVPLDRATASLLYLAGSADHNYTSVPLAEQAADILSAAGKTDFEVAVLEGMGHMCHLPFSPPLFSSPHPLAPAGMKLYMGGADTPAQHMDGQARAHEMILEFLERKLKMKAKL